MIDLISNYMLLHTIALLTGCIADLIIGDPHGIPHPIVAIGRLISSLEQFLLNKAGGDRNKELRYGAFMCFAVILLSVLTTALILIVSYMLHPYAGAAVEAVLTCYILAARSMYNESMKVYHALRAGNIEEARKALSMIVGRDTGRLDEDGIIKACVETVAENTSDGVIAPFLYTIIGGPILGMFYKAVNTMDSMVGYRNEKYEYFGKAAAKLDDIVNYVPSRLSALLMIAATASLSVFTHERRRKGRYYVNQAVYSVSSACRIWIRDRRKHLSPNSAQTESACAGALGIRLGGSSYYGGILVDKPYIGDPIRHIEAEDIKRANRLMFISEMILPVMGTVLLCYFSLV